VNQFFDGVSARIAAGVKEAEISYQLQFSKQELRKVKIRGENSRETVLFNLV
jgi:hypothetical protein